MEHGGAPCRSTLSEHALGRSCSPWRGDHAGAGDLAGAAAHGGPRLEQFAPDGWTPWYRAMWEQFLKNCCLWEAHAGSVREGWHPVGGTPCGTGAESGHEGVAETKCCRLTAAPIPRSPAPLWGMRWKRVDGGGRCFWFLSFVSHFSSLLLIGNKSYDLPTLSLFAHHNNC